VRNQRLYVVYLYPSEGCFVHGFDRYLGGTNGHAKPLPDSHLWTPEAESTMPLRPNLGGTNNPGPPTPNLRI
jgi:hypothetical protein